MSLPNPLTSRAVLIGTSEYDHLEDLPAVANNLDELEKLLTDEKLCGLPAEHCVTVSNPRNIEEMLDPVVDASQEATDVLLVYFAGHGLLHSTGSDLYLTLVGSNKKRMYYSVAFDNIRNEIKECRAKRKLVILDCCYSGRALNMMGDDDSTGQVANSASLSGVYLMASTAENKVSKTGDKYTEFTGELISIIKSGIPDYGEFLDVDAIFQTIRATLRDKGLPVPQRREKDYGSEIHLFRNQYLKAPSSPLGGAYGAVLGVEPGVDFETRLDLHRAGIHRPLQAGICGTVEKGGAESIVVSGGYNDDRDYGDTIIYTGHGGRDPNTGQQVKDQSPEDTGNAALIKSMTTGQPVRVVRGSGGNPAFSPDSGYRYDGLYRVTDYSVEQSVDGPRVLLYRLERLAQLGSKEATHASRELSSGRFEHLAPGIYAERAHAEKLKRIYGYACQICGVVLNAPGRQPFASVVYLRGLGPPHSGEDSLDNMLCVCSNHRDMFKFGALVIEDDFTIIDEIDGEEMDDLTVKHEIDLANIRYHREHHRLLSGN